MNLNVKGLVVEIGEGQLTKLQSKYMRIPSIFMDILFLVLCAYMSFLLNLFLIESHQVVSKDKIL